MITAPRLNITFENYEKPRMKISLNTNKKKKRKEGPTCSYN